MNPQAASVVFRVDSSPLLGGGHAMRCLTLANELKARGARVAFIASCMLDSLSARIRAAGHQVLSLGSDLQSTRPTGSSQEEDAAETARLLRDLDCDWLIVDSYSLDARWERVASSSARALLVVDDLADRQHECDVLLDQNYYQDSHLRYAGLVPRRTLCLLGPRFALLRPQFHAARRHRQTLKQPRVFVSLGARDPFGVCAKIIASLGQLASGELGAEIVVGHEDEYFTHIKSAASGIPGVNVHGFVDDVARLMTQCTFAIGAGGSSTWERCAVGLPSLVLVVADNQRPMAHDLAELGVIQLLGEAADVSVAMLSEAIAGLLADPQRCSLMRARGMELVDGLGARRVVDRLLEVSACIN